MPLEETVSWLLKVASPAVLFSVVQLPATPLEVIAVLGLLDARGGGAAVGRRQVDLDRAVVRVARRRSGGVERRRRGRGDDLAVDRVRGDPEVVDLRRCRRAAVGVRAGRAREVARRR